MTQLENSTYNLGGTLQHSNTSWLAKIGADCQHFILSSARAALARARRLSKLHFCPARQHSDKQIFLQVFKYYLQLVQIFLCPPIYRAARDALWWRWKMEWVCNFLASWPRLGGYSYQVDVARVWLEWGEWGQDGAGGANCRSAQPSPALSSIHDDGQFLLLILLFLYLGKWLQII